MMELARTYGQTDIIVVGLVLYGLLGLLSDGAVRLVERRALSMAAHAGELTLDRRTSSASTEPGPRLRAQGRPQRRRPRDRAGGVRRPARPQRLRQEHPAAGAGRARPRRSRAVAGSACPHKVSVVFQDSRLLPWARVLDNVVLGQPGRVARDARQRGARRGRPRRPREGLAAPALRRRAAAGRAGPLAGPRTGAAAGRRAVRRARRAHPPEDARPAARAARRAPAGGPAGHPRRRRGDHARRPGRRARPRPDRRSSARSTSTAPGTPRIPAFAEIRRDLLARPRRTPNHPFHRIHEESA